MPLRLRVPICVACGSCPRSSAAGILTRKPRGSSGTGPCFMRVSVWKDGFSPPATLLPPSASCGGISFSRKRETRSVRPRVAALVFNRAPSTLQAGGARQPLGISDYVWNRRRIEPATRPTLSR